MQSSTD